MFRINRFKGILSDKHTDMLVQRTRWLFQLERDWLVALVNVLAFTIKNVIIGEYLVETRKTPFNISPSTGKSGSGGVMFQRDIWSSQAVLSNGKWRVQDCWQDSVTSWYVAVAKAFLPLALKTTVEFNFADGHGLRLLGRISLFNTVERCTWSQPVW